MENFLEKAKTVLFAAFTLLGFFLLMGYVYKFAIDEETIELHRIIMTTFVTAFFAMETYTNFKNL